MEILKYHAESMISGRKAFRELISEQVPEIKAAPLRFIWIAHPFKTSALAGGKVHIPVPSVMLSELASTYDFQNHQYYCRGVAKIDCLGIAKICIFAIIAT